MMLSLFFQPSFNGVVFYLDPGVGSVLFQIIIGGLLAVGVFVRLQWARIKKLFGQKDQRGSDANSE